MPETNENTPLYEMFSEDVLNLTIDMITFWNDAVSYVYDYWIFTTEKRSIKVRNR